VDNLREWTDDKTYLVLLQNNMELRPTGGFVGSFARVRFKNGELLDWKVVDIYEPDGKLTGHVEPPYPVQEAFRQGWWKLRDSNWDVDFASAAATMAWFFEQGGENKVDGIIGLNLGLVNSLIGVLGPIKVHSYDETVTGDNFYFLAQEAAEVGFRPGSTQKRDFLGAVGTAVWERIKSGKAAEMAKLLRIIKTELERGEIMIWVKDEKLKQEVEFWGWEGKLGKYYGDYLYIVESNLGANKGNCCINRQINQDVSVSVSVRNKLIINWQNENPGPLAKPPYFWGGDYINYVRVVVPDKAKILSVSISGEELRPAKEGDFVGAMSLRQKKSEDIWVEENRDRYKIIGFWAVVPAGLEKSAEVQYELPKEEFPDKYRLTVQRQPGTEPLPFKLTVNGKTVWEGKIDKVTRIETELVERGL
jgi:predicted Rdx family selenoprotein